MLSLKGRTFREITPGIWRLEPQGKMRVGLNLVGHRKLLEKIADDKSIDQAINVTTLPGVQDPVLAMPDIHQGYGFPIGGVAAFHAKTGVVSPGGVGYDINCGVRLLRTSLNVDDMGRSLSALVNDLFQHVPAGVGGQRADVRLTEEDLEDVLKQGAGWAVGRGFGTREDLKHIEEGGCLISALPEKVSARAKERGQFQLGTLGSGNHFIEIQVVDELYEERFGLRKNQIVIMIHTGSRGLGYQVCADYLEGAILAAAKYDIELPDRELAAVPIESPEGKAYLGAMASAANFAFANRQMIAHWVEKVLREHFPSTTVETLYDVCHNIAKFERFGARDVCVHRKGATRAYPGQPVIVPGDMGRYSFVLVGKQEAMERSFGSACHGAGRELSRSQAKKLSKGRNPERELLEKGILVRAAGRHTLVEEMSEAYKDVAVVAESTVNAGLAGLVARLRPLAAIKG